MGMTDGMIHELEMETAATRRLLERVPPDKLAWKPHEKSMSMGQLTLHVATIPGNMAEILSPDSFDFSNATPQSSAQSAAELLPALEESVAKCKAALSGMDDARVMQNWTMFMGEKELMSAPRIGLLRSFVFSHWYHHRGQLTVYLRLNDVPLPSTYGPSADENPFV